jgi:hypothetical protein
MIYAPETARNIRRKDYAVASSIEYINFASQADEEETVGASFADLANYFPSDATLQTRFVKMRSGWFAVEVKIRQGIKTFNFFERGSSIAEAVAHAASKCQSTFRSGEGVSM